VSAGGSTTRDPAATMAAFAHLAPLVPLFLLLALIFYPILYAAMNRAVLNPNDEGLGYIRLGTDELRQLGLMLLILGVAIVAYIAMIIAIVIVTVPVGLMLGGRSGASPNLAGGLLAGLLGALLILAVFGGWIYVWVRLSLASALTFATRKVNLFGSWSLTRGLFWPMLGAYLVAFILAILVLILTGVINLAVIATAGGGLASAIRSQPNTPADLLSPARLISLVVGAISTALVWPVTLTPPAAIYRSLPGSVNPLEAASAFD
jgi:hypothetical protein